MLFYFYLSQPGHLCFFVVPYTLHILILFCGYRFPVFWAVFGPPGRDSGTPRGASVVPYWDSDKFLMLVGGTRGLPTPDLFHVRLRAGDIYAFLCQYIYIYIHIFCSAQYFAPSHH